MAVLARVNWVAQQRVDLNHVLAQESFLAFDFRSLLSAFSGLEKPYIIRGFEVVGKTGLTVAIRIKKSLTFNVLDGNGSFYAGGEEDADVLVDLPADQENIFLEARFLHETGGPVNTAFWDSLALSGEDVAGTEFTAATNTQDVVVLEISANTIGFSEDAIPIMRASTSASLVTEMIDARDLLFRLGTGGTTPNALHKFPFSNTRAESVSAGTGISDEVDSPFRSSDSSGVRNDKGLKTLKDWADAVMTRIAEIAGTAYWWDNSAASLALPGITLNSLFFDTIGYNIQPSANVALTWKSVGGDLVLASEGASTVKWQSNYSRLQWELGGTFVNNTPGGSRAYSLVRFTSPSPVNNGNIYLLLEREVAKGSGASVSWYDNTADTNLTQARTVSGVSGDFTGIAVGDYIRKESEGYLRYYKVARVSDGVTITNTDGFVSDNTIVAVELDLDIVGGASSEPLRYFRARYSDDDLVADTVLGEYSNQSIDYQWLGRHLAGFFYLKNYGTMQEGEEVTLINDEFIGNEGGQPDLMLEHQEGVVYDGADYKFNGGPGLMLKIYRRKRNNTVETPGGGDNSGALIEYTLSLDVSISPGQQLWVKLNDDVGGALSPGSVAGNSPDDETNNELTTNVFEVLDPADTPLRNYDNRDVFMLARAVNTSASFGSQDILIFFDGTVLGALGHRINNTLEVTNELYLQNKTAQSVLFIDQADPGRVDEDNANFYFDKSGQVLGVFNYLISPNVISLTGGADQDWLPNLDAFTLYLGSTNSTIRVRGDLMVDGNTVSMQTIVWQVDDKLITMGVGNISASDVSGSGIEVADTTQEADQVETYSGQDYIDVEYSGSHGYTLGESFGISSNVDIGGITATQMTGTYTVVGTATVPGEAEIISGTVIRLYTYGTATSSLVFPLAPPTSSVRGFEVNSYIRLGAADGVFGAAATSWVFKTFAGSPTATLTPVASYQIIPKGHTTNMLATRIPFVNDDNAGPGGVDSTLNFSGNLTWDDSTNTLNIEGNLALNTLLLSNQRTITTTDTVTDTDCVVMVDTTGVGAPITITLPPITADNIGQLLFLKDVGGELSLLNKRAYVAPDGSDTIISDEINTSGSPFQWDIDYSSLTLIAASGGRWLMV